MSIEINAVILLWATVATIWAVHFFKQWRGAELEREFWQRQSLLWQQNAWRNGSLGGDPQGDLRRAESERIDAKGATK